MTSRVIILKDFFLKSPLKYTRISSKFQKKRYHPVLKKYRPHLGVDYAAAKGTPVYTVGDGIVELITYNKKAGRMIKIRHNKTYKTAYKHLSKFSKNLKRGSQVKQGQIIGYVGSSGLATGPHLHFEFYENNRFIDPMGKSFPKKDRLSKAKLAIFKRQLQKLSILRG